MKIYKRASGLLIPRDPTIHVSATSEILVVERPKNDELSGAVGLPATDAIGNEHDWVTAIRAGYEKLGVRIQLGHMIGRRVVERSDYVLDFSLFAAKIAYGEPTVGQSYGDVTQYVSWRWGNISELKLAAARGSLCCQIALSKTIAPHVTDNIWQNGVDD